jgi:hypothetical protein
MLPIYASISRLTRSQGGPAGGGRASRTFLQRVGLGQPLRPRPHPSPSQVVPTTLPSTKPLCLLLHPLAHAWLQSLLGETITIEAMVGGEQPAIPVVGTGPGCVISFQGICFRWLLVTGTPTPPAPPLPERYHLPWPLSAASCCTKGETTASECASGTGGGCPVRGGCFLQPPCDREPPLPVVPPPPTPVAMQRPSCTPRAFHHQAELQLQRTVRALCHAGRCSSRCIPQHPATAADALPCRRSDSLVPASLNADGFGIGTCWHRNREELYSAAPT